MRRLSFILLSVLTCSGCTFSLDWIRQFRAQQAIVRQDYASALPILNQIVIQQPESDRALSAARQGARVAHLEAKNYEQAVRFYKHLVLKSPDPEERKSAQRFIAQIYFENLQDFDQAVIEYEKLLKLENTREEKFRYRLNLAKSHFNLNNLDQALNELNHLLEKDSAGAGEGLYEIKMLKANILVANRRLPEAAQQFGEIIKEFPERSAKENVALNQVVVYEELKDFTKAIQVLESMRENYPNPEFLNLRIERLRERQANLPGAQGLKR